MQLPKHIRSMLAKQLLLQPFAAVRLCSSTSCAEQSIRALHKSQDSLVLDCTLLARFKMLSAQSACRAHFGEVWPISI